MIAILSWEEPPPPRRKGVLGQVDRVVEELQKRPGQWARVEDAATGATAAKKWEGAGCETQTRSVVVEVEGREKPAARYRIWARWPAPSPAERAKAATPQELAAAYAENHGHIRHPKLGAAPAPAADDVPDPAPAPEAELTPASVKEQLAARLLHKGSK